MTNEILIPEEILEENAELSENQEADKETVSEDEGNASERTVPLSALQKEREEKRKYRDEAKALRLVTERLLKSTGAKNTDELLNQIDEIEFRRKIGRGGYNEKAVRELMKLEEENRNLKKNEAAQKFDRDVQELAQNPLYSDILEVRDEVEEFARSKGISVREAYNALFGEERIQRLQKEAVESALADRELKNKKKIHALASPGSASGGSTNNLSQKELEIANAAGITPAEYAKYKM